MMQSKLLMLAMLAPALASADARIHTISEAGGESSSVLSVRDGRMLMMSTDDDSTSMLFDSDSGNLTVINHGAKSYMTVDDDTMDHMQGQMNAAMQEMQERLKSMPEEQRKMIMERMPQLMPPEAKPAASYSVENTGESAKVADMGCKRVTLFKNGEPEGQACIASPGAMGIADGDFKTMAAMFTRLKSMAGRFSNQDDTPDLLTLGGFPLRMTNMDGTVTTEVTRIETQDLDSSLFEIPAGYKPETMPGMPR